VSWQYGLQWVIHNSWLLTNLVTAAGFILVLVYLRKWLASVRSDFERLIESPSKIEEVKNEIINVTKEISSLTEVVNTLLGLVTGIRDEIPAAKELVTTGLREVKEAVGKTPKLDAENDAVQDHLYKVEPEIEQQNQPPLPCLVTDYLAYLGANEISTIPVMMDPGRGGKTLVRSDEGNYVVVSDGGSENQRLVPKLEWFSSTSTFSMYFSDQFECDEPQAGAILINQPALVRSNSDGGWEVIKKGSLAVK